MAQDPKLKDAGNNLMLLLKQSGQKEASRYVMAAVRESGVAALRLKALKKLSQFPQREQGGPFKLPSDAQAALDYLKNVADNLLQDLNETQNTAPAPAPLDFLTPTSSPEKNTTPTNGKQVDEPVTWNEDQTPGSTPHPLGLLPPESENETPVAPPIANEVTNEVEEIEKKIEATSIESSAPENKGELLVIDENDDLIDEDHPYDLPFFDGVDRVFFAGHEALAYFVQNLYHKNAMPVSCGQGPVANEEKSVSLFNQNTPSGLLDVVIRLSKTESPFLIFDDIKETETEARNICDELYWTKVRTALAQKPRPIRPPELRSENIIFFVGTQDFNAVRQEAEKMAAIMLTTPKENTMPQQKELLFQIGGSKFSSLNAHIQPMGPKRLVASFLNRESLLMLLEEIDTAIENKTIIEDKKTAGLSLMGALSIPQNASELLEQSFENQPTTMDLNQPSAIILLRVLTGAQDICEIIIKQKSGISNNFFLRNGLEVYGRLDEIQIANFLSKSGSMYAIVERPKIPPGLRKMHLVKILANTTRLLLSKYQEESLFDSLNNKMDLAPKLTPLAEKRVHILNLPKLVERHVTFRYNGQENGSNLLLVEGNRKAGLEAMALLEMHNFLEWVTPTISLRDRVETLFDHFERIKDAGPFETLGLHWFCAPIELIENYHEHRQLFSTQGTRRKEGEEWAEKIWEKVESAFRFLDDKKSRDLYRKENFDKKKRKDMASLLMKQARMDTFRQETFTAQRKLEAAMDFYPNSAAQSLLDDLTGKKD